MNRGGSVTIALLVIASFLAVPLASAGCPDPPRDCSPAGSVVKVSLGNAELDVGAYKNSASTQSDGPQSPSFVDAATKSPSSSNQEAFGPGDVGGILVIVNAVGGAESFTVTFPENPSGLEWTNGNVLVIDNPEADGHYLLPFEVATNTPQAELAFTATDNRGNEGGGTVEILPHGALESMPVGGAGGLSPFWPTVLVFGALAVLLAMPRFKR